MKKFVVFFSLLAMSLGMMAQQPVITFAKTDHDFGKIKEEGGRVTTVFEFKNEGMEALVLSSVKASCGCTTPNWSKAPIEPGETGTITVTYNPNGRPGRFMKTITVTSNASNSPAKLFIKGEVIPKPAKPVNRFPVKMGELSISDNAVNFGTILNTDTKVKTLEYANLTDKDIQVEVLLDPEQTGFLIAQATLATVHPGESGQLNISFDAAKSKLWGEQKFTMYLKVNGKRVLTDEYKVTVSVSVDEDFSKLTSDQKRQAPIAEIAKELNLGMVKQGAVLKGVLSVKNVGVNPLLVRNVNNPMPEAIHQTMGKSTIKSGKKMDIKLEINTAKMPQQLYRREMIIQTNDPQNPKVKVVVVWTVE